MQHDSISSWKTANPINWAGPSSEVLKELLAPVWIPTNAEITVSSIRDSIGLTADQYSMVRDTLETAIKTLKSSDKQSDRAKGLDLQDAIGAMVSRGTSLSALDRQAMIDLLSSFGGWSDVVRDAVKSLGGSWFVRWQIEGYPSEPTLDLLVNRKIVELTRSTINAKATAINAWLDRIDFNGYSELELQTYCDSLLASEDGNPSGGVPQ